MATYITLVKFTEQGMQGIKESPQRSDAFAEEASRVGASVKSIYWTSGSHDGVLIFEAPDEATASALVIRLVRKGNVTTSTLRAYDKAEMESLLEKVD